MDWWVFCVYQPTRVHVMFLSRYLWNEASITCEVILTIGVALLASTPRRFASWGHFWLLYSTAVGKFEQWSPTLRRDSSICTRVVASPPGTGWYSVPPRRRFRYPINWEKNPCAPAFHLQKKVVVECLWNLTRCTSVRLWSTRYNPFFWKHLVYKWCELQVRKVMEADF